MEIPQWRERKEVFFGEGGFIFIFKNLLEMFKCLKFRNVKRGLRENGLLGTEV